jgi:lipopolysaccharide export LptBFGC system permease protein LptF
MGILSLVRLLARFVKPADLIAFAVSAILAYMASTLVPEGPWANYTFILVYYHLFLAWLLIDADYKTGVSLSIVLTILTHLACLTIIISYGMGQNVIPFYRILRYGVIALAIFERNWLFSGGKKKQDLPVEAPIKPVIAEATADDYEAWLKHLTTRDPTSRKPGMSVNEEYQQWLVARIKRRIANS